MLVIYCCKQAIMHVKLLRVGRFLTHAIFLLYYRIYTTTIYQLIIYTGEKCNLFKDKFIFYYILPCGHKARLILFPI